MSRLSPHRRSLRRSVVVLTALVALSTAACGVSADQDRVSASAFGAGADTSTWGTEAPADANSATVEASLSVSGIPDAPAVEMTLSGSFDQAAETGRLTLDLGDLSKLGEGMGELPADAGKVEVIVVDDAVYVKSALLDSFGGAEGKPWVKIPLDELSTSGDLGGLGGTDTDGGTASGGSDSGGSGSGGAGSASEMPKSVIAMLEAVGTGITDVGTETVRGTPTRHVRTTLDLDKIADLATEALPAELSGQLGDVSGQLDEAMAELSTIEVPVDVWIDQDGRIRKATVASDLSGVKAEGSTDLSKAKIAATIEAYDYDEPVTVTAPPASQVRTFDPADLLGGMLGGN